MKDDNFEEKDGLKFRVTDNMEEFNLQLDRGNHFLESMINIEESCNWVLPEYFDAQEVELLKSPECMLCKQEFKSTSRFAFSKGKSFNCTRCGLNVCDKCSMYTTFLSMSDENKYKVCNKCFCYFEN